MTLPLDTPPAPVATSVFDDPMPLPPLVLGLRGRLPRKAFWLYGVLGPLLVSTMLEMLLGIVGVPERQTQWLASALLLWPCTAVTVKRWHDRDRSGWWVLVLMVPLLGTLWTLYECGLRRGTEGDNRFGPDLTGRF
jgi:uncharacterized membrane protein YhaH (DUF805 family)